MNVTGEHILDITAIVIPLLDRYGPLALARAAGAAAEAARKNDQQAHTLWTHVINHMRLNMVACRLR